MTKLKHILSVDQFDDEFINTIFHYAKKIEDNPNQYRNVAHDKIISNLFYEPSTRTSSSFYSAITKLGGSVIPINEMSYSSVSKGENLEDTIRTMSQYCDAIVLRHSNNEAANIAASVSDVPIINAGAGTGSHPTQAVLDLYTIIKEKGKVDGLSITFVGDLKHGRTVHSLVKLLRHYNVNINFVAPRGFEIPEEYINPVIDTVTSSLSDVIRDTDVFYITRLQKERIDLTKLGAVYSDDYCINNDVMANAKHDSIVLHPLPRVTEIHPEFDTDPRAVYFRQVKNGLYVRMAILMYLFNANIDTYVQRM